MPWKKGSTLFCDFLWWFPGRPFDFNDVKSLAPLLGGDERDHEKSAK